MRKLKKWQWAAIAVVALLFVGAISSGTNHKAAQTTPTDAAAQSAVTSTTQTTGSVSDPPMQTVHRHRATSRRRKHPAVLVGALPASTASVDAVQSQPRPGSCHARGAGQFSLPDPRCTPGAVNPAVTQATIDRTICVTGWTKTVRPSESITEPEKAASMAAYGDEGSMGSYEYDHLIPLELGGAANDPRNLWPEPGGVANPKDSVENALREAVCDGRMPLRRAQHIVATDWVAWARRRSVEGTPRTSSTSITRTAPVRAPAPAPPPGPPSSLPTVHPGAYCSPNGARGLTVAGTPMICGPASDGRDRWHHS
jgi:hypothetical protein